MYRTVTSPKKSKLTLTRILLYSAGLCALVIILIYIAALFPQNFRLKDKMLEATFPLNITLISLLILAALHYIFFSGKKADYVGELKIMDDEIFLNNQKIAIDQVKKLRIIGNDIKGDFRGFVSKGTKNQISIELENGEKLESNFEQTPNSRLQNQKSELEHWLKAGKLAEANFYNISNNTNYY